MKKQELEKENNELKVVINRLNTYNRELQKQVDEQKPLIDSLRKSLEENIKNNTILQQELNLYKVRLDLRNTQDDSRFY